MKKISNYKINEIFRGDGTIEDHGIYSEIEYLQSISYLCEDSLKRNIDHVNNWLDEKEKERIEEPENYHVPLSSKRYITGTYFYFDNILYSSLLISCYSFLENKMKIISETIENIDGIKKISKKPKNISYLNHYFNYINSIFTINVESELETLCQMNVYKSIRNDIVHNNGLIKKKNLHNYTKLEYIKINEMKIEILSIEFLIIYLHKIHDFINIIEAKISDKFTIEMNCD